jgi:NADPH:quinone reductase-like Zn-dependent oxidoreductase
LLTLVSGTEENRQLSPLVDEETWNTLMIKTGFTGTELVLRDYESDLCHEMSFIISKAVEEQRPSDSVELSSEMRYKLVVEKDSILQRRTAEELQQHGKSQNCQCDIMTIEEATATPDLKDYACIFLPELEHPLLTTMDEKTYYRLKAFLLTSSHILWLTKGGGKSLKDPGYIVIDGFARSLRLEVNNLKLVTLALQDEGRLTSGQFETIFKVMDKTIQSPMEDYEREFVEKNGMIHTNRIVEANTLKTDFLDRLAQHKTVEPVATVTPVLLDIEVPGQLDTVHFKKDKDSIFLPEANEVEIEVKAIELGFADYSVVTGRSKESKIGAGCCGIVLNGTPESGFEAGDRVWMHGSGMCKTVARAPAALVTKLPTHMSFEQVCSLPSGSLTVAYAMHQAIRIRKGEKMLLRCSKMLMEAAVQIAIAAEVDLYIVADDEMKKEIVSHTEQIPESHIISGPRFSKSLKKLLGGRGVDVILNSVDEDISQCFECLSPFGTFVDIVDHRGSGSSLRGQSANSNITSVTVNSALIAQERPQMLTSAMEKIISLVAAGALKAFVDVKRYPVSQVKEAFEELGAQKESGKVVLTVDREDEITVRKT